MNDLPAAVAKKSILGPLFGAVGAIAPAAFDILGRKRQNRMSIAEARRAEAFAERMSSTAVQRSVKDFEAAGLNPALAYDRQASSPSGVVGDIQNELSSAYSSAQQARLNKLAIDNARQSLLKLQAEAKIATNEQMKSDKMWDLFQRYLNDGDGKDPRTSTVGMSVKSGFDLVGEQATATRAAANASDAAAAKVSEEATERQRMNQMFEQMKVGDVNIGKWLLFIKSLIPRL